MLLGIKLIYSRIRHPQTQGKIERFHRTLKYDLIKRNNYNSLEEIQEGFNAFQFEYNNIRPHEAIEMKSPVELYRKSEIIYTGKIPKIDYPQGCIVKKLNQCGCLAYKGKYWFISEALSNQQVMLIEEDLTKVFFINTLVRTIDLRENVSY